MDYMRVCSPFRSSVTSPYHYLKFIAESLKFETNTKYVTILNINPVKYFVYKSQRLCAGSAKDNKRASLFYALNRTNEHIHRIY